MQALTRRPKKWWAIRMLRVWCPGGWALLQQHYFSHRPTTSDICPIQSTGVLSLPFIPSALPCFHFSNTERIPPQIVVPSVCPHHILLDNSQFNYPVRVELYDRTRFLQQIPSLRLPVCKAGALTNIKESRTNRCPRTCSSPEFNKQVQHFQLNRFRARMRGLCLNTTSTCPSRTDARITRRPRAGVSPTGKSSAP